MKRGPYGGSPFIDWLADAGLEVRDNGTSYYIPNLATFRQRVERNIVHGAQRLPALLRNFDELLGDAAFVDSLLQPCGASEVHHAFAKDSLCRLLLNIQSLQPHVAKVLLEKLPEYETTDASLATKILRQFRWLDVISQGTHFTDKILEVMEIVQDELKREFISLLPNVVDVESHPRVVSTLLTAAREDSDLLVVCLDALGNLELSKNMLDDTLDLIFSKFQSVKEEALPMAIKFLLQMANSSNSPRIIAELRTNLPLSDRGRNNARDKGRCNAFSQSTALILEALRSGLRFRKDLVTALLRDMGDGNALRHPDLLLLVLLYSFGHAPYNRTIEAILRKKLGTQRLTAAAMHQVLSVHADALAEYFGSLLPLACTSVRSGSPAVSDFGQRMLCSMFGHFRANYHRQEIIGSLLSFTSSHRSEEVDAGLDILLYVVCKHFTVMRTFASFLMGILDEMVRLTPPQTRKVYLLFAILGFGRDAADAADHSAHGLRDELHMMVNKQISHSDPKYKIIGYMGLAALLACADCLPGRELCRTRFGDGEAQCGPSQTHDGETRIGDGLQSQLQQMLGHCFNSICHAGAALPHMYDELATVMQDRQLDAALVQAIAERVGSAFQNQFLIDRDDETRPAGFQSRRPLYELQRDWEVGIRLGNAGGGEPLTSSWALFALFRLMQTCERQLNAGSVEGVRPVLSCPVFCCDLEVFDDVQAFQGLSTSEKDVALITAFFAINWWIELLNSFADDSGARDALLDRLHRVARLQSQVDRALVYHPSFTPVSLRALLGITDPVGPAPPKAPGEALLQYRKAKKQKVTQDGAEDEDPEDAVQYSADLTLPHVASFGLFLRPLSKAAVLDLLQQCGASPGPRWSSVHLLLKDVAAAVGASAKSPSAPEEKSRCLALLLRRVPLLCTVFECALEGLRADSPSQHDALFPSQDYLEAAAMLLLSVLREMLGSVQPQSQEAQELFRTVAHATAPFQQQYEGARRERMARAPEAAADGWLWEQAVWGPVDQYHSQPEAETDAAKAFRFLYQFLPLAPTLDAAHSAVQVLQCVAPHAPPAAPLLPIVSQACEQLLKREWGGKVKSVALASLLRLHVTCASEPLAALEALAGVAMPCLESRGFEDTGGWDTLSRGSSMVYYKYLLESAADLPAPCVASSPGAAALLQGIEQQVSWSGFLLDG